MNEGANIAMVTEEQKQVNTLQYCGSDTDENGIPCPSTYVIRLASLAASRIWGGDLQAYFATIPGKIGSKIMMWGQAGGESELQQ